MATGALGLVAGFLSNALGRKISRPWHRIGPAEDLNAETFQKTILYVERRHAWVRERTPVVTYIKDLYPEDPLALLPTCTHLGCSVRWDSETDHFRCPCHGGVYNEQGKVVEGPPPRPLTRLEVKIEDDICFVRLPDPADEGTAV